MAMPRILVVEDERIIAADLKMRLRDLGYDVSAIVPSGEEAIQQAETQHPDLILMDLGLKGRLDGVQTAQLIHERYDIPVVYVTAHADPSTIQRTQEAQAQGYLLKPYTTGELKTAVESVLSHKPR